MASARDLVTAAFPAFARDVERFMANPTASHVLPSVLMDGGDVDRTTKLLGNLLAGGAGDLDLEEMRATAFVMLLAFLLGVWMGEEGKGSLMPRA